MLVAPLPATFQPAVKASVRRLSRSTGEGGWSTSSFGVVAETSPVELSELSEHLDRCRRSSGRFFSALCLSDRLQSFLAPRVVTTLIVIALLIAALVVAL
jgi:hypothetical protein